MNPTKFDFSNKKLKLSYLMLGCTKLRYEPLWATHYELLWSNPSQTRSHTIMQRSNHIFLTSFCSYLLIGLCHFLNSVLVIDNEAKELMIKLTLLRSTSRDVKLAGIWNTVICIPHQVPLDHGPIFWSFENLHSYKWFVLIKYSKMCIIAWLELT